MLFKVTCQKCIQQELQMIWDIKCKIFTTHLIMLTQPNFLGQNLDLLFDYANNLKYDI